MCSWPLGKVCAGLPPAPGFDAEDTLPSAQAHPAPNTRSFRDTEQGGQTPVARSRTRWVLTWGSVPKGSRSPWARSTAGLLPGEPARGCRQQGQVPASAGRGPAPSAAVVSTPLPGTGVQGWRGSSPLLQHPVLRRPSEACVGWRWVPCLHALPRASPVTLRSSPLLQNADVAISSD